MICMTVLKLYGSFNAQCMIDAQDRIAIPIVREGIQLHLDLGVGSTRIMICTVPAYHWRTLS